MHHHDDFFRKLDSGGSLLELLLPYYFFISGHNQRLVLALMDCTVMPANGTYVTSALTIMSSICNLSSNNAGFAQLPLQHSQITQQALLKNRRKVEDTLGKSGLDVLHTVSVFLNKSSSMTSDKRKTSTPALFLTTVLSQADNRWLPSQAWISQSIGPVPLIRVSDMRGYEADQKPSAAARIEQILH